MRKVLSAFCYIVSTIIAVSYVLLYLYDYKVLQIEINDFQYNVWSMTTLVYAILDVAIIAINAVSYLFSKRKGGRKWEKLI